MLLLSCILVSSLWGQKPKVYLLNADTLMSVQQSVFKGEKRYLSAAKKLMRDAEKVLKMEIPAITDKELVPPSGDKRDYYSLSRYWWPDPKKEDGLPYIRRDGETNPETESIPDNKNLNTFMKSVTTLAWAYFYSGDEKYAESAVVWLRTWLINPETRMNPNLRFSQQVRGRDIERGTGILDAREFSQFVDAIGIVQMSRSFPSEENAKITQWFKDYLQWLVESPNGISESNAQNNHGTWYDVQTTAIALFVGDKARALQICEKAKTKRIAYQITPEGKEPEELVRTLSWHYSQFNLYALTRLADLARNVNVDLWNFSTTDGRSIRTCLDYLIPFADKEKKWEATQIKEMTFEALSMTAMRAAAVYGNEKYLNVFNKFYAGNRETDRTILQYGVVFGR